MTITILAILLVFTIGLIRWKQGTAGVLQGFVSTTSMMRRIAPMILLGLTIASMAEIALPANVITTWLGDEAGFKGIVIGVAVGSAVPAGPYVVTPLAGSLLSSGAGIGSMIAFITAWSVTPVSRTLVWEVPFLGFGFALSRYLVVLPFPFIAGVLAPPLFEWFGG